MPCRATRQILQGVIRAGAQIGPGAFGGRRANASARKIRTPARSDYLIQSNSLLDFFERNTGNQGTVSVGDFPIFGKLVRAAAANVFRRAVLDMRRARRRYRRVRF